MSATILSALLSWIASFPGFLTITIIMITSSRLYLSNLCEKHGKDSRVYRGHKTVMVMLFVIVMINLLSFGIHGTAETLTSTSKDLGAWLYQGFFGNSHYSYTRVPAFSKNGIFALVSFVIYALIAKSAYYHVAMFSLLLADVIWTASIGTVYGFWWGFGTAILSGIITGLVCQNCDNKSATTSCRTTREEPTTANHPIKTPFMVALWLGSIVAAYLAGEFSLIPKAAEYVKDLIRRHKDSKPATSTQTAGTTLQPTNIRHTT